VHISRRVKWEHVAWIREIKIGYRILDEMPLEESLGIGKRKLK
jgi:hypothetical protein